MMTARDNHDWSREHVYYALRLLVPRGQVTELRALNVRRGRGRPFQSSGYFDDLDAMADAAAILSGQADGVYFLPNPVDKRLLARSCNKLKDYPKRTTTDAEITRRVVLLLDFDAIRPAGIPATDSEHTMAIDRARAARDRLHGVGFPPPVLADSGNGAHLVYRVDLPRDDKGLLKRCLEGAAFLFDDIAVQVDRTVYNAARIWKMYGTLARKGDGAPGQPHRYALILDAPEQLDVVPEKLLLSLADAAPKVPTPKPRNVVTLQHRSFDLENWLRDHSVPVAPPVPWSGGRLWRFLERCPFDAQHKGREFHIAELPSGAISAGCQHATCPGSKANGNAWDLVRELFEPGYKDKQAKSRPKRAKKRTPAKADPGAEAPPDGGKLLWAPLTDYGNAERLMEAALDKDGTPLLRWCGQRDRWLYWTKKRWCWDETGIAERYAKRTIRQLYEAAIDIKNDDYREQLRTHARRSESAGRLKNMLELFKTEPGIGVLMDDLDANDWLLNCQNGEVDLRTGELHPHRKESLCTKIVRASYGKDAECREWEDFLYYIMDGDTELVRFLQRALGYSLTGVPAQELFFCYGLGANGKSVYLEVISRILADYAGEAAQGLMLEKKSEQHQTEIADLTGRRFVTSEEVSSTSILDEGKVKRLTSGRNIKARFMRQDLFEFRPTHKLWLAVNHKPRIRSQDKGIWRRIKMIPFRVTIPDKDQKPFSDVVHGFLSESDAIVRWLVNGCLEWQRQGLNPPRAIHAAIEDYRDDMDILGRFLREKTVAESEAWIQSSVLYKAYQAWAEQQGMKRPWTQTAFSLRLQDRGMSKITRGTVRWLGIRLRAELEGLEGPEQPSTDYPSGQAQWN